MWETSSSEISLAVRIASRITNISPMRRTIPPNCRSAAFEIRWKVEVMKRFEIIFELLRANYALRLRKLLLIEISTGPPTEVQANG